jgi:hypothetical protein
MTDTLEHADLIAFATSRGGRLLTAGYLGVATLHRWRCARDHEFDASPRLLIHGGYWCPTCMPTVDDPTGWDWDAHAEVDSLLARFHRPLREGRTQRER